MEAVVSEERRKRNARFMKKDNSFAVVLYPELTISDMDKRISVLRTKLRDFPCKPAQPRAWNQDLFIPSLVLADLPKHVQNRGEHSFTFRGTLRAPVPHEMLQGFSNPPQVSCAAGSLLNVELHSRKLGYLGSKDPVHFSGRRQIVQFPGISDLVPQPLVSPSQGVVRRTPDGELGMGL